MPASCWQCKCVSAYIPAAQRHARLVRGVVGFTRVVAVAQGACMCACGVIFVFDVAETREEVVCGGTGVDAAVWV